MCFSMEASFGASILLTLISTFTIKRARPNERWLAAIPLAFAMQQFIEGLIWYKLTGPNPVNPLGLIYCYLAYVYIYWPLAIPISIREYYYWQSTNPRFLVPFISGLCVAGTAIYYAFIYTPQANVMCNHIRYTPELSMATFILGTILYLNATITPFFLGENKKLWGLGALVAISYGISYFFYYQFILSVWCFLAAILSVCILLIVGK